MSGIFSGGRLKLVRMQLEKENVKLFSYRSLLKATDHFATRMGQGGFGPSFKGTLKDGTIVFIKRLYIAGPLDEKFLLPRVKMMSRIRHPNVVEFVGCCVEDNEWILVNEFIGVHNLQELLFDHHLPQTWAMRAHICLGVALGLEYLHNGISRRVVHGDIKPRNIVLDENYNPKIVGCEAAHVLDDNALHYSGPISGTVGYMDPEFLFTGKCTQKADVYGFGILLLEVISGTKVMRFLGDSGITLLDWVREQQQHNRPLHEIVDPRLTEFPEDEVMRFIDVALLCIQVSSQLRPSMSEVLPMLSGDCDFTERVQSRPQPPAPAGLGDASVLAPEMTGPWLNRQMSADVRAGSNITVKDPISGPSLETSVNSGRVTSTSEQTHMLMHSAVINDPSLQVEGKEQTKVLLPPKLDIGRPIQCTVDKILEALRSDQFGRIAIHGKGGSGKTTVLRTVSDKPAIKYIFDRIILVNIPWPTHRRKIQNEIMQQLSLNLPDSNSEDDIAAEIRNALTGKRILLLLDEVWEFINLHTIGIPIPRHENSNWLVLASRSWDACNIMGDMTIEMEALSGAEVWELFCNRAGNVIDSPEIEGYARAIGAQCCDSPLIISAVASALKGESNVDEWALALQKFDTSNYIAGYPFSLSPCVKYCHDRLKADSVKNCFLYCCLFPRDREIAISMLIDCLVAEGLLGERRIAAYKKGYDIVEHLVNACLLEATNDGQFVKMHNAIRDSALVFLSLEIEGLLTRSDLRPSRTPILKRYKSRFIRKGATATELIRLHDAFETPPTYIYKFLTRVGAQLKEAPVLEEWEPASAIFLMENGLSSLPSEPSCPDLEALLLQRNTCLRVIPTSFFDHMCSLRLLNLSKTRIKVLPDSVSKLENLEVLIMRDCERLSVLPPQIGSLKALEVLDLEGTELLQLPDSIRELTSLKQLRVSFYGSIDHKERNNLPRKLIPDGAISSLDLIELGIFVYPGDRRWTSSVSRIIKEVRSLKLSSLYFHFPDEEHLDHFLWRNKSWKQGNLAMFKFNIGDDFKHAMSQVSYDAEMMHNEEKRCLRFVNGKHIPPSVQAVLCHVTSFYLDHHLSICNLSDFGLNSISALKICILRDCPNLRAIVNDKESPRDVLPCLEYLSINYLWSLNRIWVGKVTAGSLAKLRYLSIQACPSLSYVLTSSMLHNLPNLEELVIEDCALLDRIIIEDEEVTDDDNSKFAEKPGVSMRSIITSETHVLHSLKVLKLHYLPKLQGIWNVYWPPLEYISFYDCPELKNLHMDANAANSIKEIAANKAWWDKLDWDEPELPMRLNERLSHIDLDNL
ncbi:hypothetical protein Cgig2_024449 [Carnegiea gigantea]|uniref:Protein kinase domain-containing protein n=1 Tax=Carnegiea gigantea TaxID=171969 RepID=A0A9Q1QJS7_9CARY|nr:hypothetical protein Cgig2_024449 [Carnegiea gigantea]